jgi:hypothetical protein
LLRRFYRGEMLGRVCEPAMITYQDDYRRDLFDAMRRLALERFPEDVFEGLVGVTRLRAVLLREDRMDDLVELARRCKPLKCVSDLSDLRWSGGRLIATVTAELTYDDEEPLVAVRRGDRYYLDPRLTDGLVDIDRIDVTEDLSEVFADVVIRNRDNAVEWFVPTALQLKRIVQGDRYRLVFSGTADLDPMTLHGGAPLPYGTWDVSIRMHALGLARRTRIGEQRAAAAERGIGPALFGSPPRFVLSYWTGGMLNLSFDIDERSKSWATGVAEGKVGQATVENGVLSVPIPVVTEPGTTAAAVRVVLGDGKTGSSCTLPAEIRPTTDGRATLRATISAAVPGPVDALRAGEYPLSLATNDIRRHPARIGSVVVSGSGRATGAAVRGSRPATPVGFRVGTALRRSRFRRPIAKWVASLPPDKQLRVRTMAKRWLRTPPRG